MGHHLFELQFRPQEWFIVRNLLLCGVKKKAENLSGPGVGRSFRPAGWPTILPLAFAGTWAIIQGGGLASRPRHPVANDHKRVAPAMCDRILMPFAFSRVLSPFTYYVRRLRNPRVPNTTLDPVHRGSFTFSLQ